jgi:hypothetical protein
MTHNAARCSDPNKIIHTVHGRNAELGMCEKLFQQVKTLLITLTLKRLHPDVLIVYYFIKLN